MLRFTNTAFAILISISVLAQDVKIEPNKTADFTKFKTFTFGESEIITPKDRRLVDEDVMNMWVKGAITNELTQKGLTKLDSAGDLTVSYIVGTVALTESSYLGPMGVSPTDRSQVWNREFDQGNLVVDLHDRSNILMWRIVGTLNTTTPDAQRTIEELVTIGYKKFSIDPPKNKKKKKK
ncbi:MAG: DUF4136 domain-containing protein [Flammeovirgaceae bacterium]|nr:DUF4136 domain-containing protein [Flammeovirgaceae bacterium]